VGTYYLDIETTGREPESAKIITIQYQEIDRNDGTPKEKLTILKEWEHTDGEEGILRQFIDYTPITDPYQLNFVPVGTNLSFEHKFLNCKAEEYSLPKITIENRPTIDIKTILVMMNRCEFQGSDLDMMIMMMTGRTQNDSQVPSWYQEENYQQIIKYVEDKTAEFSKFFVWLCKEMPILHRRFGEELSYEGFQEWNSL